MSDEGKQLAKDLTDDCDFHMPATYQPGGGPHYWMQEASGILAAAVKAFVDPKQDLEPRQFELLRQYVAHWINAPCFPVERRLEWIVLLERAKDRQQLWAMLRKLDDEAGIDPL